MSAECADDTKRADLKQARDAFAHKDYETAVTRYSNLFNKYKNDRTIYGEFKDVCRAFLDKCAYASNRSDYDVSILSRTLDYYESSYRAIYGDRLFYFYTICLIIALVCIAADSLISRYLPEKRKISVRSQRMETLGPVIICIVLIAALVCYRGVLWRIAANSSEFLFRPLLGKDLIDGLRANIFAYRTAPHDSSATLVGLLCVPFFLCFGDSFFSVFLVSQLFSLGILFLVYWGSYKYFGRVVAVIASFLFVFAPFGYLTYRTFVLGFHTDSAMFSLIAFFCFSSVFYTHKGRSCYFNTLNSSREQTKLGLLFLMLGLMSGFAAYVCYSFMATIAIVLLFWFFEDGGMFKRKYIYLYLGGSILMFLPWIIYNIDTNFSGFFLRIHDKNGVPISLIKVFLVKGREWTISFKCLLHTLRSVFAVHPLSTKAGNLIPPFIPRNIFYNLMLCAYAVCGITLGKEIIILPLLRRRKLADIPWQIKQEALLFSHVTVIGALYCLYPVIWPSANYLHPAFPCLLILLGLFVKRVRKLAFGFVRMRAIALLITGILIFSGFHFYSGTLNAAAFYNNIDMSNMFKLRGYSLAHISTTFMREWAQRGIYSNDLRTASFHRGYIYPVFSKAMDAWLDSGEGVRRDWETVYKKYSVLNDSDKRSSPYAYIMLGISIGDGLTDERMDVLAQKIDLTVDAAYRQYVYEGIALSYCNQMYKNVIKRFKEGIIDSCIPTDYRHYFYTEIGRRICVICNDDPSRAEGIIQDLNSDFRRYIINGFLSVVPPKKLLMILEHQIGSFDYVHETTMQQAAFHYGTYFWNDVEDWREDLLENYIEHVPPEYRRYCLWGIVYGALSEEMYVQILLNTDFPRLVVPQLFERISMFAIDERYYPYLYEGIGITIGIKTFGRSEYYDFSVGSNVISEKWRQYYISGLSVGNELRYGQKYK